MRKNGNIVRYSADELRRLRATEGSLTDWARIDAMTEAELEASIAADPDWRDIPRDWYKDAVPVRRDRKRLISLRLDGDIVDWFRARGPGYQTRINGVLRAYVRHAAARTPAPRKNPRQGENPRRGLKSHVREETQAAPSEDGKRGAVLAGRDIHRQALKNR
jgi:uncharacterized protein (DUF4415 family)